MFGLAYIVPLTKCKPIVEPSATSFLKPSNRVQQKVGMRTCTSQHRRTVIEKRHHLATESCFIDQDSLVGVATFTTPKPLACSLATLESPSAVEQRSIYEHVQLRKTERVFVLVSPPSSTSSPYPLSRTYFHLNLRSPIASSKPNRRQQQQHNHTR